MIMNTSLTPLTWVSRPIRTVLHSVMIVAIWLSKYRSAQALFILFVFVCVYSGIQPVVVLHFVWLKWRVSYKYPSRTPGFTSGLYWVHVAQLCSSLVCVVIFVFVFRPLSRVTVSLDLDFPLLIDRSLSFIESDYKDLFYKGKNHLWKKIITFTCDRKQCK